MLTSFLASVVHVAATIFVANLGGFVAAYDPPYDAPPIATFRIGAFPDVLAYDTAHRRLFVGSFRRKPRSLRVYAAPFSSEPIPGSTLDTDPRLLAFGDGLLYVGCSCGADGNAGRIDALSFPYTGAPAFSYPLDEMPNAMAADGNGNLYAAQCAASKVLALTQTRTVEAPPLAAKGLTCPMSLAIGAGGKIFVGNNGGYGGPSSVFVFPSPQPNEAPIAVVRQGIGAPNKLLVDPNGTLYVLDEAGTVKAYAPPYTKAPSAAIQLDQPRDMTFDGSGNLAVTDIGRNEVAFYALPLRTGEKPRHAISHGLSGPQSILYVR